VKPAKEAYMSDLIPPEALQMIGKDTGARTGVVYKKEFQRWAAAVNDLNPLYFDEDFAKRHGYRDVVMPPLFLSQVLQGVTFIDTLRPDGIPGARGEGDIPLRAERRMAGGDETEFFQPIYPNDVLTARSRILNIEEKLGRSGAFVLVTRETEYRNQDGVVVALGRSSIIAR
jgi:acyl dehydratase